MKYIVTINNKNYEVEVEKGQASVVKTTQIAEVPVQAAVPVAVVPAPAASSVSAANQANVGSGDPIKAPMPGIILAVKVEQGAAVKKGDVLLILEAMKMENEITAPRDGVVTQIIVTKGTSVSTGDILLALQ